jgi:hypothetical protein
MVTVENNVGRLIEVRFTVPSRTSDSHVLQDKLIQALAKIQGQVVICTLIGGEGVLPPEDTGLHATVMRRDNARVERAAVVVPPDQPMLALQLERVMREAGNPARRLFQSVSETENWLSPVLAGGERVRLHAFLATFRPVGASIAPKAAAKVARPKSGGFKLS